MSESRFVISLVDKDQADTGLLFHTSWGVPSLPARLSFKILIFIEVVSYYRTFIAHYRLPSVIKDDIISSQDLICYSGLIWTTETLFSRLFIL